MYLQCPSRKSGTAIVVFYAVSLLYVLATVCFVTDLVALIIDVSNNSICKHTIFFITDSCAGAMGDRIASTSN